MNLPTLLVVVIGAAQVAAAAPTPTLLEITHASFTPAPFSQSVVLVIDAQREYVDGKLPLAGIADALRQTGQLLARARREHVPIIHVQQLSPPRRGVFDPSGPYVAIMPEAAPLAGETVISKKLPNAFAGTGLDEDLKKIGRKQIVISGYMTHMCVSATARAALDLGYRTVIIADACATRDLPDEAGGVLDARTVHRVALAELRDRFSAVVPTLDAIP